MNDFEADHNSFSVRQLQQIGVGRGWKCIDAGAGGGAIAAWLGNQVGPEGYVLALDIDERRLRDRLVDTTNIEVQRGDVLTTDLPAGRFDLAHGRLFFCDMPARDQALDRVVASIKPGGWMAVHDIDFTTHRPVEASPAWDKVWGALLELIAADGWDVGFGGRVASFLEDHGLERVEGETVVRQVRGGSTPCRITWRGIKRERERLIEGGHVTEAEYDAARDMLLDPERAFVPPAIGMAWGRRAH